MAGPILIKSSSLLLSAKKLFVIGSTNYAWDRQCHLEPNLEFVKSIGALVIFLAGFTSKGISIRMQLF
jgi:hypothetical protein